ncbi:hypothetical protein [Pseudomonas tohonis]|uniref:hypothetical protein n=1 Tax=Pseudomonas tohonis TaxID=2725477 RepID=UPI001F3CFE33|nr:hypothetical protein [Pseudomonas tohonis]
MKKYIVAVILFAVSSHAYSRDYFWYLNSIIFPAGPAAYCKSLEISNEYARSEVHSSSGFVSDTVYKCAIQIVWPEISSPSVAYFYRDGDGCGAGTIYNTQLGVCEAPRQDVGTRCGDVDSTGYPKIINTAGECVQAPRADIAAFCKFHGQDESYKDSTLRDVLVQKDPNGNPIQPSDTAQFGCAVTVTGMNCTTPAPAETCSSGVCVVKERSAVCSLNVHHSGQVFNDKADPGVLANARCQSGDCLPPEPKQDKESKPCTYVSTGQNSVACVSSEFFSKEGQSQCGTVNGVLTCKNDLPKPVSGGIRISTEVTSEPQPDGTTKQTKKDTRTDTKCTGMALAGCVTSSTTSTTVTIKDGSGNVISTIGSCTGKGCPDSNTNPDADGDGFGDCVGGDCGEGEGGASGSGVEFPELEEAPEYADSAQGYFDRLSNAPIARALKNISVPSGGSCNIGSVQVYFGTIDFNSFCTQAPALLNGMYYLFLAIWAWAAIRLFFTA